MTKKEVIEKLKKQIKEVEKIQNEWEYDSTVYQYYNRIKDDLKNHIEFISCQNMTKTRFKK